MGQKGEANRSQAKISDTEILEILNQKKGKVKEIFEKDFNFYNRKKLILKIIKKKDYFYLVSMQTRK